MFRATCSNTSPSGYGKNKKSIQDLYATENALRYIGAYILVFDNDKRNDSDRNAKLHCWHFGSERGLNMGLIAWNVAENHADPYWQKRDLNDIDMARRFQLAPWELSVAGTGNRTSVASSSGSAAGMHTTSDRHSILCST